MPREKPTKQVVYGLWVIQRSASGRYFGRWLEWKDVRLGGKPWDPHLGGSGSDIYVFSSRRAELEKVLKYMRGEGLPAHVLRQVEETCLANYIYPENTEDIVIRKVELPAPSQPGVRRSRQS